MAEVSEIERGEQIADSMKAQGEDPVVIQRVDYFDFGVDNVYTLPDDVSTITHSTLNEGARSAYLKKTNRDVAVNRGTNEAKFSLDIGGDRKALLEVAVTDWDLIQGGTAIKFSAKNLNAFLTQADPSILDGLEKAVRMANPWLLDEVSVEQIDEQIEELEELRDAKLEEEAGKEPSK